MRTLEQRFWRKVDKNGPIQPHMKTRCWVWTGALCRGYGLIAIGNRRITYAHRVSWTIKYGPPRLCVLHKCDFRGCVRPSHLFQGTVADNNWDMSAKGRIRNGDRKGMKNARANFTDGQIREIRRIYSLGGISQYKLAEKYGVSRTAIELVVQRKTWKHI